MFSNNNNNNYYSIKITILQKISKFIQQMGVFDKSLRSIIMKLLQDH